jgi:branched-chain amino acid transport system permease protein
MLPSGTFSEGYGPDMAIIRTRLQWGIMIAGLLGLFTLPLYGNGYVIAIADRLFITIISVVGLQIVTGYCGQISLGQAVFMMLGGYATALLSGKYGLPFLLVIPLAGIASGLIALIGGAAALRVKGFYLALATLALHFLIYWIVTHVAALGSYAGLPVPPAQIGNLIFDSDIKIFYLLAISTVLMTFFARNLVRGRVGRALIAIRDNDLAANVMGINIYFYRVLAFFISAFYGGVSGALGAFWYQSIFPEQHTFMYAITYLGMIIVGGIGSISGAIIGAISLTLLDELALGMVPVMSALGGTARDLAGSLSLFITGLVIVLFIVFQPRGLAHRWEVFKVSYRVYPFTY